MDSSTEMQEVSVAKIAARKNNAPTNVPAFPIASSRICKNRSTVKPSTCGVIKYKKPCSPVRVTLFASVFLSVREYPAITTTSTSSTGIMNFDTFSMPPSTPL